MDAIKVKNLSKEYRLGVISAKTLSEEITNGISALMNWNENKKKQLAINQLNTSDKSGKVMALRDINFSVKAGEILGIIGKNGAGKSTLLKLLSRVTSPTNGTVIINGKISSLLEVGTGFNPELTGKENIYLNGAILGMKKNDIEKKLDKIIEFSGIKKYIDTPVKRYSSGMRVRLGFAVAAHLDSDIILIDEVLAVGDAIFQRLCVEKILELVNDGRTILFVSHNMTLISQLCTKTILLNKGKVEQYGNTKDVIRKYMYDDFKKSSAYKKWDKGISNVGVEELKVLETYIKNEDNEVTDTLHNNQPFKIIIKYRLLQPMEICHVGILINTIEGIEVFDGYETDDENLCNHKDIGCYETNCLVPENLLNEGKYFISIYSGIAGVKQFAKLENALSFQIIRLEDKGSDLLINRKPRGIIRPQLIWSREISSE